MTIRTDILRNVLAAFGLSVTLAFAVVGLSHALVALIGLLEMIS